MMELGIIRLVWIRLVKLWPNWNGVNRLAANGLRLGGRFNAAKPLLYEVPTYLAQNFTWNDKQKNKKKKSDGKF